MPENRRYNSPIVHSIIEDIPDKSDGADGSAVNVRSLGLLAYLTIALVLNGFLSALLIFG